jgi:hypothetical protein
LATTATCFGADADWYFRLERLSDNLGNQLRSTGAINSKIKEEWKTADSTHVTYVNIQCAWGGGLKSQCEKFCTMIDTTVVAGD